METQIFTGTLIYFGAPITQTKTYTAALAVSPVYDQADPLAGARPVDVAILGVLVALFMMATLAALGIWVRGKV